MVCVHGIDAIWWCFFSLSFDFFGQAAEGASGIEESAAARTVCGSAWPQSGIWVSQGVKATPAFVVAQFAAAGPCGH